MRCCRTAVIGQADGQCEEEEDEVPVVPSCWLVLPNVAEDDD